MAAMTAPLCLLLLLLLLLCTSPCHSRRTDSVSQLEKRMYTDVDGNPCVRLLNLTGELGCGNPGRDAVVAPIRRFDTAEHAAQLGSPTTVLIPALAFQEFLKLVGDDGALAERIVGVLVEAADPTALGLGFSDDSRFPQSAFAPYDSGSYEWNPVKSAGIMSLRLNFPVFLLSKESTLLARRLAAENTSNGGRSPDNVAEFNLVMQTTKVGTQSSESCLKEFSCLPLGGYSVLSTLPAVNASAPTPKPIVLAMSSMDSASFFRDVAPGADSPMSGVLALLVAVDAISRVSELETLPKRLVFLVLTGESMGYLGSRQFLAQLRKDALTSLGLKASSILQILEVGSVGQASDSTFFIHKQATAAAIPTQQILESLQSSASASLLEVQMASSSNPGIPPSSLMSFVHKDPAIAGVVIEDFDTVFKNKFYHSEYDDERNVNTTAIAAAASLVAQSLVILASDNVLTANSSTIESIQVNVSLVEEMVDCFYTARPGMRCRLVDSLMTASQDVASHYVGVFVADPRSSPVVLDDTSRFVWNFLADRTQLQESQDLGRLSSHTECTILCKNSDEVCVSATENHTGQCVVSSTRYVPAYSPRLSYDDSSGWQLLSLEMGDMMGAVDPVYAESFWGSISLQVYQQERSWYDEVVLFSGVCFTFISVVFTFISSAALQKRLKRA